MRRQRSRRPTPLLLAVALLATVAELYAVQVYQQRELARMQAQPASATVALAGAIAPVAVPPTPTPIAQTPDEALKLALGTALEVMRAPDDGRIPALQRVADSRFVSAFQREIDHLRKNRLRLTERSGYRLISMRQVLAERGEASLVTEEHWVYEEQSSSGEVVRCLTETSSQRYQLEWRGGQWVVADVTLAGNPRRGPCDA